MNSGCDKEGISTNIMMRNFSDKAQRDKKKTFEKSGWDRDNRISDPSRCLKGMQIEENKNKQ